MIGLKIMTSKNSENFSTRLDWFIYQLGSPNSSGIEIVSEARDRIATLERAIKNHKIDTLLLNGRSDKADESLWLHLSD